MRKRHQAILISSNAKKNICNEISLNLDSYEVEQKQILNNYFKENISPEDIDMSKKKEKSPENVEDEEDDEEEKSDLEDLSDSEEEYISINSNIKVPPLGEQKGPYIKYQISENAFVGGINYNDYTIIPKNRIKINKENNNDKGRYYKNNKNYEQNNEERIIKTGEKIDFNDILEQMAYWSEQISLENSKDKKNRKNIDVEIPDINILQLFKLYPKQMEEIQENIKIIDKEMRDKNLNNDNCPIKKIINDQENIIIEQIQNITKISKELDRIKDITYGNNFSLIEFK